MRSHARCVAESRTKLEERSTLVVAVRSPGRGMEAHVLNLERVRVRRVVDRDGEFPPSVFVPHQKSRKR
jgi:hypothetical protein